MADSAQDYDEAKAELQIEAVPDKLPLVFEFVESKLAAILNPKCSEEELTHLLVAVEEIFVNIADYAYGEEKTGMVCIQAEVENNPPQIAVRFSDEGTPWNPLLREDPDVSLPARKRKPGGLGIFMAKKLVTGMDYERLDGQNILTLTKQFKFKEIAKQD